MADKDRKAEIERRKKRLEELRQAREAKKKDVKTKEQVLGDKGPGSTDSLSQQRENVDDLVAQILGSKDSTPPHSVSPLPSGQGSEGGGAYVEGSDSVSSLTNTPVTTTTRKQVKLSIDQLMPVNIRPKVIEQYEKHTQTELRGDEGRESDNEEDSDTPLTSNSPNKSTELTVRDANKDTYPEVSLHPLPSTTLSEEDKEHVLHSEDFGMFLERSTRIMERALVDTSDMFFDLLAGEREEDKGNEVNALKVVKKRQLCDNRWTRGRIVSSLAWSPHHPGMLLSSYYQQESNTSDPDGVLLLWDLKFNKDTPDYTFNCHSPVMSVTFSKFHPHYVIGGTYSGQVVLWDIRSGKRTPVQRSLLSSSAHTHPIYSIAVVGSQNAHNIISISSDGRLCSWNIDNLSQPQESLELQSRHPRPVAVTSLTFPLNDVNKFIVGSEEGAVYQGQRHGKKPGVVIQYEGHYGSVTSVASHRAASPQVDFSHLFLSSSIDWTIKLWSTKLLNEQQITSKTVTPLCSFETNSDYIYDLGWSPTHPAIFASIDGEGQLDIWNINHDYEAPIVTEVLDAALCKLSWSHNGHNLAIGDKDGNIYIYEVGEALSTPQTGEWTKLSQTLLEIQQSTSSSITEGGR